MKEAGKCIILTTHFLEEADVLSDRIAVMTSGRLQAHGTPDFLKSQTGIFHYQTNHSILNSICNRVRISFVYRQTRNVSE